MVEGLIIFLIVIGLFLLVCFVFAVIKGFLGSKRYDLFMIAASNKIFCLPPILGTCTECGEEFRSFKCDKRSNRRGLCPKCFEKLKSDRLREFRELAEIKVSCNRR